MNLTQRFTLLVKGSVNSLLDSLEDPERSLYQLVLDMEEELEKAKRAAAGAIATRERLQAKIAHHENEVASWQATAERGLRKGREDEAREALRRREIHERRAARLRSELESQAEETEEIQESVAAMQDRLSESRARLQLLQARLRHGEARSAMNRVMRGAQRSNLYGEFDRLSERVEETAAAERAYRRLDDALSGDDFRRRVETSEVDEAVEDRLAKLREDLESSEEQ